MSMLTLNDMARMPEINLRPATLDYAIKLFGPPPVARAGLVRLWDRSQLPLVMESLAQIRPKATARRMATAG